MELQVIQTIPGDDHFHFFEEVLKAIYAPEQLPLKQQEGINPDFLHAAYVVLLDNKAVGRCCVYFNNHLRYQQEPAACIGNYECIDDSMISAALFQVALGAAETSRAKCIIGPMNGSTWDNYRLGEYGKAPNFFLEPFYPGYYHEQFRNAGFEKIARYVSNTDRTEHLLDARVERVAQEFVQRGITFRNIDLDRYEEELDHMHDFCMDAFKNNFLFSPIRKETFIEKYMNVKSWIKPEYVIIAEDSTQEMAGFIFCLENYFDKKEKGLLIKTVAKKPSVRFGGMGNLLATRVKQKALENGHKYIIHAFMIESNASRSLSEHFSGETTREYYLYGKRSSL